MYLINKFCFSSQIHIEKQIAPPAPVAAILSNKLVVDNDEIRNNLFDLEARSAKNSAGKRLITIPIVNKKLLINNICFVKRDIKIICLLIA